VVIVLLERVKILLRKNVFHVLLEHFSQNQTKRCVTYVKLGNIKMTQDKHRASNAVPVNSMMLLVLSNANLV